MQDQALKQMVKYLERPCEARLPPTDHPSSRRAHETRCDRPDW